jgi:hypothetical protein
VLKPSITREPWTEEEDRAILHYQAQLGNKWSHVAKFVPGKHQSIDGPTCNNGMVD